MAKTGSVGVDKLVYSSMGLKLAAALARATPPRLGHFFALTISSWISSRPNSPLVDAVRSNQRMIAGPQASPADVERHVRDVLRNAADSIYELYHYAADPSQVGQMYCLDASFDPIVSRPEFDRRGLVIAGLHMAGFDLGLRWLCRYKFKPLVLTMPDPQEGRRLELEGRREMQMNVLPYSAGALRHAIRHLQQGGMVLTGIDHPVPPAAGQPRFLGQPTALPTEHVYLALRANVPVVVVASHLQEGCKYRVLASRAIEMERHADRSDELQLNAQRVLALAEPFVRHQPGQWLIFQPVWPGVTDFSSA
jgi:phosphatidylinositol dimannoside acyltransferase